MKTFIQSGFVFLVFFFASNFQVQGATVITIGGPRDVCKNATTSYTVEATNAQKER